MKTKIVIAGLLLALGASAQDTFTQRYGSPYRKAPPKANGPVPERQDLRLVEGKLYDASKSVLWTTLTGECLEVRTNGILLRQIIVTRTRVPSTVTPAQSIGAYAGEPVFAESYEPGSKKYFIRNYPLILRPAPGRTISAKALRVGFITLDSQAFELWDYGTGYAPPRPAVAAVTNIAPRGTITNTTASLP